ncbi:hypothetical protein F4560_004225 [Saccharothrix ecbatanensis]|uniref:Uncharacterized protein n=1 Tax=Saccharothrix ecbatanensis TaxID=1105145 RepID=A0A7W9HLE6_9PSEU|nr:hypothetical protein [Saccharothrix ecbatanensis]MBB5804457.1 hypothetical protein [Saccharothrix ecbatanensis]
MSQPNMTAPGLPPRRPLPPDVRERMRRRVLSGGAVRSPLAAAAAVAVLAAGGAIIAQSTGGDMTAVSPPSTTSPATGSHLPDTPVTSVSPGATTTDAARCGLGDADVRFTLGLAGRRILVTRDDRFCELTHTTISNNNPEVGPVPFAGGVAAVLWRSGSGVLIGRAPAGTSGVRLESGDPTGTGPMPVSLVDELFVTPYTTAGMSADFTTPSGPVTAGIDLVALPRAQVWAAAREELPPGDPDVARCLDRALLDSARWVGDPLKWRPGATSGQAPHTRLVIHDQAGKIAYCEFLQDRPFLVAEESGPPQRGESFEVRYVTSNATGPGAGDGYVLLAGTVDAARVGGMEITTPQGRTVAATLRDGTFLAQVDQQDLSARDALLDGFRVRVLDHGNQPVETVTLD